MQTAIVCVCVPCESAVVANASRRNAEGKPRQTCQPTLKWTTRVHSGGFSETGGSPEEQREATPTPCACHRKATQLGQTTARLDFLVICRYAHPTELGLLYLIPSAGCPSSQKNVCKPSINARENNRTSGK
eukprot:364096-Chlamydomonas_euryale.AAC.11